MKPLDFLKLLWPELPLGRYLLVWTLQEKRSRWFQSLEDAAVYIESCQRIDLYVGVGLAPKDYGPAHRCPGDKIAAISALWADLDLRSKAHGNKPLPASERDALSILPAGLPPSTVVSTGNGLHAWWIFKEPWVFDSDEERVDAARLAARWSTLLRVNAASRGWSFDRLSDLARVLRVPGTQNWKDPENPKPITVYSQTDRRYNPSDLEEYLDDMQIPDPEAQESAAKEWAERFADKPLVIDVSRRIPEELLNAWIEQDMRFRNTWLRHRHDLKDQSQSGYDLALADFGVDAGLSEQQIVDLVVHHRAQSGQKQRTRLDYFQRTIAKAHRRAEWREDDRALTGAPPPHAATLPPGASQVAQGAAEGGEVTTKAMPDPNAAKILLCDQISRYVGVQIQRLVKITGKEPTYHMELADGMGKIEFSNVGKLIAQESVRLALAGQVGTLMPKIKPKQWEAIAQLMLNACIVEEGTEEMEWEGAARMYVAHYLSETGLIPSVESQIVQNQRKPMVSDGHITICASDLQIYIAKTMFQNLSVKAVGSMLKALGAESIRVRSTKHKDQSRWRLPLEEFSPEELDHMRRERRDAAADE